MGRVVCPRCKGDGTVESDTTVKMGREEFEVMIANAVRTPPPPPPLLPSVIVEPERPERTARDIPRLFPDERETLASQSWMVKRVKKIERSNRRIALGILLTILFIALAGVAGWLWQRILLRS